MTKGKAGRERGAGAAPKASAEAPASTPTSPAVATASRDPVFEAPGFDIDDPHLPDWIEAAALSSGGYPLDDETGRKAYEAALEPLQIELLKLQAHNKQTGGRIVIVFEGRDAAGKGGCIQAVMEHLNPRHTRVVALTKPTEAERGQWYFQRYIAHLPTRGDIVLFDRSWYNRAGVERVMGFCTPEETRAFLREVPGFEALLIRDGLTLIKVFLVMGREMQLKRFHERRHDPLKRWKLTDMDLMAIPRWDDYTAAKWDMFAASHTDVAPWVCVWANDQRRARLEVMRHVLSLIDYEGRDATVIGRPDPRIVGVGAGFFDVG